MSCFDGDRIDRIFGLFVLLFFTESNVRALHADFANRWNYRRPHFSASITISVADRFAAVSRATVVLTSRREKLMLSVK